jgi:hypothetical protein
MMTRAVPPLLKFLSGLAATLLLARGAEMLHGGAITASLGRAAADALLAHGVSDGHVTFTAGGRETTRHLTLWGTADAATRRAVITAVARHPGVASARWGERGSR